MPTTIRKESKKFDERKKRLETLLIKLKELFPEVKMALNYTTHFELLVAVMLSAQCTDKRVNEVTAKLFKKYNKLDDYVYADLKIFEQDIRSTGFYRNKAKNILATAKIIKSEYRGRLPKTMKEMVALPGVARKTANVVLGNAYGVVEGIAVDTHVRRFVIKFDLSDSRDPKKIERELMEMVPQDEWFHLTYYFIEYGRMYCVAHKHECDEHPLTVLYPEAGKKWPRSK